MDIIRVRYLYIFEESRIEINFAICKCGHFVSYIGMFLLKDLNFLATVPHKPISQRLHFRFAHMFLDPQLIDKGITINEAFYSIAYP